MHVQPVIIVLCIFPILHVLCDSTRGINGGLNCAVCTIVTGIIQQRAYLEGMTIYKEAIKFCKTLPKTLQSPCVFTVNALEPLLIDKRFLDVFTPDLFCHAVHACHIDPGEHFCHLFPESHTTYKTSMKKITQLMKQHGIYKRIIEYTNFKRNVFIENANLLMDFCKIPIFNVFCTLVSGNFTKLHPMLDIDKDGFSIIKTARGSHWRGKDCSDINPSIYPGAKTMNSDSNIDHDCNGIWGNNPENDTPWEKLLCEGTKSFGIVYIGDSIGAHFEMPESWINPTKRITHNVATITEILLDEIDWPQLGYFAGYMNSTYPDIINGTVDSIYLRLRAHNLCSHRDYQNLAKNGALAVGGINQAKAVSRKPSDKPVIVIYAMMVNDICNRFRDTVANMTKPDIFRNHVMKALNILDDKLPKNSHVILMSLIDGSFIYPAMAERVHPLGSVFDNIHVKDLYAWYNCMEIGPCEGWMTPNETLWKITSQKANELSEVLKNITTVETFARFKVHFVKNPLTSVIANWTAEGRKIYELIDPIDSTHPTQLAQPLMAEAMWDSITKLDILGPPNPNNDIITKLFGDQGGH